MFNFFKKDPYNKKIPDDYKHLLKQHEYEEMLDIILQYFKEKGEPVLKIEDGVVYMDEQDGEDLELKYSLDNLTRKVASAPDEDRESIIYTHFNKAQLDSRPLEYFKTDYDLARQYLKILIKHKSILTEIGSRDIVYKTVLPDTYSILVFDFDDKLEFLYYDAIKEWGKDIDELFEEALCNISGEDIQIFFVDFKKAAEDRLGENVDEDKLPKAYVLTNGDFAAPVMMAPERIAPFAVGKYGSIITIPAKGTAIAAPIDSKEILGYLSVVTELTTQYFEEEPSNITTTVYWYYENGYEAFPERPAEGKQGYLTISAPQKLVQLLNEA